MKFPFLPRPSREELAGRPLQVIVRDYPETLMSLRDHGVSPRDHGDRTLADVEDFEELQELEAILDDLETATAWRPKPVSA